MPYDILHLLGGAEDESTGITCKVAALVRKTDPKRYKSHVWFLGGDGPLASYVRTTTDAEVRIVNWSEGILDPVGALRFSLALGERRFSIVHQHFGARSVRGIVRLRTKARIILHLHGAVSLTASDPAGLGSAKPSPESIPTWGADVVIAVSNAVARLVDQSDPKIVNYGVDVPSASALGSESGRLLGVACRLDPEKGVIYLIQAVASLREEFPDLRLEIAGSGRERSALEDEVRRYGLSDVVSFLGWRSDLTQVLTKWDIFVLPSLEEGLPIAVLDAMAVGLPVVATLVGGTPELVDNGCTGWLVPARDPRALADRLRALLLNAEQRRSMGKLGLTRVSQHFSTDKMTSAIMKIYDANVSSDENSK
jgi:glycosyltransferase involved in cell wall biosynthesis